MNSKDSNFLVGVGNEMAKFWQGMNEQEKPRSVEVNNDSLALGIYDYTDKICSEKNIINPMKIGEPMRGSMWYKICPRNEVIKTWKGQKSEEVISLRQKMIFEFGNIGERMLRRAYADIGILYGDWKCNGCGHEIRTLDSDIEFGDKKEKYITLDNKDPYGTKKPSKCQHCGGTDFEYIELEIYDERYHCTGHPDGLIMVDEKTSKFFPELKMNKWYILECKTSKSNYWTKTDKGPLDVVSGINFGHPKQAGFYENFFDAYGTIYVYINKNDQRMRIVIDENNDFDADDCARRGVSLLNSWEKMKKKGKDFNFEDLPVYGICESIKDKTAKECPNCHLCFRGVDKNVVPF